jgi:hypothetical protein
VQFGASNIGTPRRVAANRFAHTLKLASSDILEAYTIRRSRCSLVEIHRNSCRPPDLLTRAAGKLHALVESNSFHRNKRHDIRRTEARMNAAMPTQVDQFRGFRDRTNRGGGNALGRSGERDDASVVIGISRLMQDRDAVAAPDRFHQRLDYSGIAAF